MYNYIRKKLNELPFKREFIQFLSKEIEWAAFQEGVFESYQVGESD